MKKCIKKLLMFLFAIVFLTSNAYAKSYPDLPSNHWAYKQIQALTDEEVLVGYPDGNFKPDETATRAEFTAMVVKALHQDKSPLKKTFEFKDVPYKHWAFNTIQRAINFDLVKNTPDNLFRPEDTITKTEAMDIMISALNLNRLGLYRAKKAIGEFKNPNAPITRAEMAFGLYNMQSEARKNPNKKLEDAMKAKRGEGYVLRGITVEGTVATIPAGTTIPVMLMTSLNSKINKPCQCFVTKANKHLITKDCYIVVAQSSKIDGSITSVTPGKLFVTRGRMGLETKTVTTPIEQTACFPGCINTDQQLNWFMRIVRAIIRGGDVKLKAGKIVKITTTKTIKVDLTSGWIIE
ncbi:MAG: S-layer homology domain-containing protein [Candidatus Gastranaerophilales bacterium]|nr:S-layer homology domain-containing protein [Candidatus Gastranaerophilales bacterium]